MPTYLLIAGNLVSIASALCALVLTLRTIKATSPSEELKKWRAEVDKKLANDYQRFEQSEIENRDRRAFERLMLHCMKGMLAHLAKGNHTDTMEKLEGEIDKFLISR